MLKRAIFLILLAILGSAACTPATATQAQLENGVGSGSSRPILTVMTHDSFEISQAVVDAFESQYAVQLRFLKSGDAGTALNKAILSRSNPLADVFYGVDNTFLSRAIAEDIFEPYTSPVLDVLPDQYKLDPGNHALPVDFGDVCVNFDRRFYDERGLAPPATLQDLTGEAYRGQLVVENPATSSPGLAFLLATIGNFGADGYLDYWTALVANDVLVVNDWESAYYGEYSLHGGSRPLVVSYGSSPPAEVYFADPPINDTPSGVITAETACFRQIEFVGILRGTEQRSLAEAWVDFMLSPAFQEDMPLNMFVFPVNPAAALPQVFEEYLVVPQATALVTPDEIAGSREAWIEAWTKVVLR
jgi:thiamine transport system substrate-binding protein